MRCIWDAHWNFLSRSVLNLGTRYDEKWSWLLVQHQLMLQRNRYHIHHNYVLGTWPMNVEGDVSQSIPQSCRAQGEVTCVESREHRSLHHKLVRDWPLRSEALKDIGWDFTWELDVYRGYLSARIWHDLTYSSQDAWRRTYASVRLIVKKLLKLQKNAPKNASDGLFPYLPYFLSQMFPKGGFRGFFNSNSLSVGVYFVRWGAFLELSFSRESQKNADLFYNKPSVGLSYIGLSNSPPRNG